MLLIDFGAIKTGGGVQLATNFLSSILAFKNITGDIYLILPDSGPLSKLNIEGKCVDYLMYPDSYILRKVFELTKYPAFIKKHKIDIVYTFFGSGLPKEGGVKSVVSVAYPIICYPDSDYWKYVSFFYGFKKKIVNRLRRNRIRKADKVVVETDVMALRVHKYLGIEKNNIMTIPPSPSMFIKEKEFVSQSASEKIVFLVLSGLDPHKNLWRLPEIARKLTEANYTNFEFILSVEKSAFVHTYRKYCLGNEHALDTYFNFVGPIPATDIDSVYSRSTFLVNLSDLESFSNNYMEAWKSGLPLICGDTDFAHHICGESAIYVNAHDTDYASSEILKVVEDLNKQAAMVKEGKKRLSHLPDSEEKLKMILHQLT